MDSTSYKTEWWNGREVMPGESMRFVHNPASPRISRENLGGDIAPLFDRDKSGKLVKPRPHRPSPESYTIGDYLTGGDKREQGKLRDKLIRLTRQTRRKK